MADTDIMRTESQQSTSQPGAGNNRHSLHRLVGRSCAVCGNTFYSKHKETKCCSHKCGGVYMGQRRKGKPLSKRALAACRRAQKKAAESLRGEQITKHCLNCGKKFVVTPSLERVNHCSNECGRTAVERKVEQLCAICQSPFVVRSSNPVRTCSEMCESELESHMRKGKLTKLCTDKELRRQVVARLRMPEYRKRRSEQSKDVPMVGRAAVNRIDHWKARDFWVRSPDMELYHVQNIAKFVRENQGLFDPKDVAQVSYGPKHSYACHATAGLASLVRTVETRMVWKGWKLDLEAGTPNKWFTPKTPIREELRGELAMNPPNQPIRKAV